MSLHYYKGKPYTPCPKKSKAQWVKWGMDKFGWTKTKANGYKVDQYIAIFHSFSGNNVNKRRRDYGLKQLLKGE